MATTTPAPAAAAPATPPETERGGTFPGRGPAAPPAVARETQAQYRSAERLTVGDEALDFSLERLDAPGGEPLRLSSFRGRRPVVLFFGSYT